MSKELSTKSTKNEILDAYNELLVKVKEQKSTDRKTEKIKEDEIKIVTTATQMTPTAIVKDLGEMKLETVKTLDTLGERLLTEQKKLTDIQQAIHFETNYLNEIYEIKVNVDSLAALLQAQQEKKGTFEKEMEEKRKAFDDEMNQKKLQWKQEQENYEIQRKDRDTQLKKERQREEDEYNYNLQLKQKKETDSYETRKAEIEKDLESRKTVIATQEKEFAELKAKVDSFPSEMEKLVKETEKTTKEKLELNYKHQTELASKDIEGERKLTKQMITSLENKIKEQEELLKQLTQKAGEAVSQVQAIALKALEGTAIQRASSGSHERSNDTTKS